MGISEYLNGINIVIYRSRYKKVTETPSEHIHFSPSTTMKPVGNILTWPGTTFNDIDSPQIADKMHFCLSVSNLFKYDKALMAYKIMNNLCPNSLQGKFTTRSQISAYATRNCQSFFTPVLNCGMIYLSI